MEFINNLPTSEFCKLFENIVEHSPVVAEELERMRPFTSCFQFTQAVEVVVKSLPHHSKVEILEKHPDLAGKLADSNLLTLESTREQMAAGLHMISSEQKQEIVKLNNIYRVQNTEREELEIGLGEVAKIAKLRASDVMSSTRSKL